MCDHPTNQENCHNSNNSATNNVYIKPLEPKFIIEVNAKFVGGALPSDIESEMNTVIEKTRSIGLDCADGIKAFYNMIYLDDKKARDIVLSRIRDKNQKVIYVCPRYGNVCPRRRLYIKGSGKPKTLTLVPIFKDDSSEDGGGEKAYVYTVGKKSMLQFGDDPATHEVEQFINMRVSKDGLQIPVIVIK